MENKSATLSVIGVIFILIGILLPWRCYTTFLIGCDQLININHMRSLLQFPGIIGIIAFILILLAFLLNTAGFNLTQTFLAFIGLFYCGVLFIKLPGYIQNGGFFFSNEPLMLVLSALTSWLVFYVSLGKGIGAYRYPVVSALALALVSGDYIGQIIDIQFVNIPLDGQVKLALGLPLILLGSLIVARFQPQVEVSYNLGGC